MATSGQTSFNLDLNDLVEEAFERCGAELRSGYDLRTARRSLNLLALEWANKGINLWTVEQGSIPLTPGIATYDLPNDTIDLIEHVVRTGTGQNQSDININRISVATYATIPNKNTQGRPIQIYINRRTGATTPALEVLNPQFTVWPIPDNGTTYTLVYWRLRRMQDAGQLGTTTQDIPFRFLPAMVAGLAYHLSLKIPDALPRVEMLRAQYMEAFDLAAQEDRDRAPIRFVPKASRI
jgi:hypothetical protein